MLPRFKNMLFTSIYMLLIHVHLRRLSPRGCVRFLLLKLHTFGRTLLCWGSPATGQVSCGMIQSWARLLVIPLQVTGWLYRAWIIMM